MSAFKLLKQRRFLPFFATQFLGALNDNLFKNALIILIAFRASSEGSSGLLVNLAAGLFILPFFLFSAVAGQIADRVDKARIMQTVKAAEIAIMAVGALGFCLGNTPLLFATLFLMGTHSAFFGPVKYSILPQQLAEDELMDGNALVEGGTFLAILLGTIAGGLLAGRHEPLAVSAAVLGVAIVGFVVARGIPSAPPSAPGLKLVWNPLRETIALTRLAARRESLLVAIMANSWYWYFGATVLAQLPNFTRHLLHGDESVVTFLLAVFAVAIGIGSVLSARFSKGEIELGLVPLGALGMTIFMGDLALVAYVGGEGDTLQPFSRFFSPDLLHVNLRIAVDFALTGIFSSFFIVPLYALMQSRSCPESRSRVIAANNIYNALFMVGSALLTMMLFKLGLTTLDVLLFTALLNAGVGVWICLAVPELPRRCIVWLAVRTLLTVSFAGRERLPREGSALLVAGGDSRLFSRCLITTACGRPVHFAAATWDQGRLAAELGRGHVVCLFGAKPRPEQLGALPPGVPLVPLSVGKSVANGKRTAEVRVGAPFTAGATVAVVEQAVAALA